MAGAATGAAATGETLEIFMFFDASYVKREVYTT